VRWQGAAAGSSHIGRPMTAAFLSWDKDSASECSLMNMRGVSVEVYTLVSFEIVDGVLETGGVMEIAIEGDSWMTPSCRRLDIPRAVNRLCVLH
jgi:hypothetical protein